ncbi:hypothetical protein Thiofri_00662 [Thiorhodovibrio frisius]|nr:hypothetical protein Thiofri_00662 [Thiorhodovibrio frisius]
MSGFITLWFEDGVDLAGEMKRLHDDSYLLTGDLAKRMQFCLNGECLQTYWIHDDISGGYSTEVNLDLSESITSVKIVPENLPEGIYTKTLITKDNIESICQ